MVVVIQNRQMENKMNSTYKARYVVTVGDINFAGHMGNERPLVIFQETRAQFFDYIGYSERDIGENKGIIMVKSGVDYNKEVFHRDSLVIETWVSELEDKKFTFRYEAVRESDSTLVFNGFSIFLSFDYKSKKVTQTPLEFAKALKRYNIHKC